MRTETAAAAGLLLAPPQHIDLVAQAGDLLLLRQALGLGGLAQNVNLFGPI